MPLLRLAALLLSLLFSHAEASMSHALPRLTPRPISVDGVGEILSIDLMGI